MTIEVPDQWDSATAGIVLRRKERNRHPRPTLRRGPISLTARSDWDEAIDVARKVTGQASPPVELVVALSEQLGRLRFAILNENRRPTTAKLSSKVKTLRKAAKEIRRFINGNGTPTNKKKADQVDKLCRSINVLWSVFEDGEMLHHLFKGDPIKFACDERQFIEALFVRSDLAGFSGGKAQLLRVSLNIADNDRQDPSTAPNKDQIVACLSFIESLTTRALSSGHCGSGRPTTKRMVTISPETSARRKKLRGRALQRVIDRDRWSAKLLCAVIIDAADRCVWPVNFSITVNQACEELWKAAGGTPHKAVVNKNGTDEVTEVWKHFSLAARETANLVLPRSDWEAELRHWGCRRMDGEGPLNTAEGWIGADGLRFTVPIKGNKGGCEFSKLRRICQVHGENPAQLEDKDIRRDVERSFPLK
jgi:hypothetical protein